MKIYKKIFLFIAVIILQLSNVQMGYSAFVIKKEITTSATPTSITNTSLSQGHKSDDNTKIIKLAQSKKKDKTVAALFALLLGGWGAHRFYMGQNKLGFIRLGLKLLAIILFTVGYFIAISAGASTGMELFIIAGFLIYLLGYAMLFGSIVWNIVDFVRILTGDLEPDGGFEEKK
jgi:TM2 domain-containing membrane protein YozV